MGLDQTQSSINLKNLKPTLGTRSETKLGVSHIRVYSNVYRASKLVCQALKSDLGNMIQALKT